MHYVKVKGLLNSKNGCNFYRGCSHGCIYCDSRSKCYNFTHEFEDIEIKENAPELLEATLKSKRKRCMIGTGSMCDPYMHIEEKVQLTRRCLEVINKYDCGVALITKSSRVLRDIDLLDEINKKGKAVVQMTLTTYDEELCKILEPNVSTTKERFETLMKLKERGIPTMVWLTPILPFINDTEENIKGLLDYCLKAEVKGIIFFGIGVTLREGDREYFYEKLDKHFPGIKEKYIKTYGNAYELPVKDSLKFTKMIVSFCKEHNIMYTPEDCFRYLDEYPENFKQESLF